MRLPPTQHEHVQHMTMERFFAEHSILLSTGMVMSSSEAIKQAVQAGLGLGVVSLNTVELELEAKRLKVLDMQEFPIQRYWYVVHLKDKRLSMGAQTFKAFLLTEAKQILGQ